MKTLEYKFAAVKDVGKEFGSWGRRAATRHDAFMTKKSITHRHPDNYGGHVAGCPFRLAASAASQSLVEWK